MSPSFSVSPRNLQVVLPLPLPPSVYLLPSSFLPSLSPITDPIKHGEGHSGRRLAEVRREREGGQAETTERVWESAAGKAERVWKQLPPTCQDTHELSELHLELKQPLTGTEAAGVEQQVDSAAATHLPILDEGTRRITIYLQWGNRRGAVRS